MYHIHYIIYILYCRVTLIGSNVPLLLFTCLLSASFLFDTCSILTHTVTYTYIYTHSCHTHHVLHFHIQLQWLNLGGIDENWANADIDYPLKCIMMYGIASTYNELCVCVHILFAILMFIARIELKPCIHMYR